jgi:uncharacterized RDD family membrane protein YckC
MKCEKCGNEYPSLYYFASERICKTCYNQMSPEEQSQIPLMVYDNMQNNEYGWRAPFSYRLGAALLDIAFLAIIMTIVMFASGIISDYSYVFQKMLSNPELLNEFIRAIMPYSFVVTFLYYSLEIFTAGTLGKLVMGLQIADERRITAGYEKLAIRFFFKHLDTILSLVGFLSLISVIDTLSGVAGFIILVGFFFVLAEKRQAFHDMIAKTAVFRRVDVLENENN